MKYPTHSDQETKGIGRSIAQVLRGGAVVCLYGELGAGKTTLVKGLAEGLGITNDITSPTFTLMNVYPISDLQSPIENQKSAIRNLVHIDTYRLKNAQELIDIGVEDYLGRPGTITIIEWPEKVDALLGGSHVLKIHIEHGVQNERTITIEE